MLKKLLAIAVTLTISIAPAQALHSLEKYASAKQLASPGLLVVDPVDGRVVIQNGADKLRIPASVLKLISATTALHYIGAEKQYITKIYKTANSDEFVIKGALDPWLTSNLSFAKKNKQRFLPSLISKANVEGKKKLKIYYIKNQNAVQDNELVTAAQPISTGKHPAIPPHTMFCEVRRFKPTV